MMLSWLTKPIVGNVDIIRLFAVTGLVIVFAIIDMRLLAHLPNEE